MGLRCAAILLISHVISRANRKAVALVLLRLLAALTCPTAVSQTYLPWSAELMLTSGYYQVGLLVDTLGLVSVWLVVRNGLSRPSWLAWSCRDGESVHLRPGVVRARDPVLLLLGCYIIISRSFSRPAPRCCGGVFGCAAGLVGCVLS